jgi:hypothetical protein
MLRVMAILLALAAAPAWGQQAPAAGQEKSEKKAAAGKADKYVLFGTVFTEHGLALPGATVRVRRAGEKKVRGQARTDRRGEFGVRLSAGAEYEVTVEAKGYQAESRKFTAQLGAASNFVFRLQPEPGGKP